MAAFNRDSDILALDFDGVIADSIEECLVVGHNAFVLAEQNGASITHLSELDSQTISEAKRLRNFIRSGQDYVYIFKALHLNVPIDNQSDYDQFLAVYRSDHDSFFELFYQVRAGMSESDSGAWAGLSSLYPGMKEFLNSFKKDRLYIVTTKKVEYAEIILKHNQIELQVHHMYRAVEKLPKHVIFRQLADELNFSPSTFFFVDDQVDTLIKVQTTGVQCFLAEWGYNNPTQISQARKHDIPVLSLATFFDKF